MSAIYSFYDWVDRIRRYFRFSTTELTWIMVSILVLSFIAGFRFDDNEKFILSSFVFNFSLSIIAVTLAVLVHETAHRLIGLNMGYKTESKPFIYGLLAGVILAFMTNGKVVFLAYSGIFLDIMEKHRLGYFRHRLGFFDLGRVSLAGPLANLFLAAMVKGMGFIPEPLADKLVMVNVLFAITNTLPIPPLDGVNIMYASKTAYPFVFAAIISCGLLLLVDWLSVWVAIMAALLIGITTAVLYFNYVEPKLGKY